MVKMQDKPKRPLTAYMLWLSSARKQIKREKPGIRVIDISKKAGKMWRSLKDKSKWHAMAVKAKEDYKKAMETFEQNSSSMSNGVDKKRSKKPNITAKQIQKSGAKKADNK